MKKQTKSSFVTLIFMILVVVLVVFAFLQIKTIKKDPNDPSSMTEVEKLLAKDLELNYPGNAKEVVKMYNRILRCFYNEDLTEEEIKGLALQARILFDTELLQLNPLEEYLENLKNDIASYKEAKRTISSTSVQKLSDARYETKGGKQFASLLSSYLMKEKGEGITKSMQRYYLREDEEGRWRILYWELTDETMEE